MLWLLLACASPHGGGSDGDGVSEAGGETGEIGDSGGSASGAGLGGWFTLSGTPYAVPPTSSTCAALEGSWTLAGVGTDQATGAVASVGHALGSVPTDGATWRATTDPQPAADEAFFYLRIGAAPIFGADEGTLGAAVAGEVVTVGWTDVPVFDFEDPDVVGTSSGSIGCVPA